MPRINSQHSAVPQHQNGSTQSGHPIRGSVISPSSRMSLIRSTLKTVNIKYWIKPLVALLIYALTLYIAASAKSEHTVLGRVDGPKGNWILNILSKAGDIAFGLAVADACDSVAWRRLADEREVIRTTSQDFSGVRLEWLLSLVSHTGVEGLARILWKSIRGGFLTSRPGRWSLIRLLLILGFIPGPGIIIMANVDQKDIFFPFKHHTVSAGLAPYDPAIAELYPTVFGPDYSNLAQNMLSDRRVTWPTDPISQVCKATNSCSSYLVAGTYRTVNPPPFGVEVGLAQAFRVDATPLYQIDFWDTPIDLAFSRSTDCNLYGGVNGTSDYSFITCISQHSPEGILEAAWAACEEGYAANGTCLRAQNKWGSAAWSTSLQIYRRNATVTFSRTEFTIEEVKSLSKPIPQQISPASLFRSLDIVYYPPLKSTNDRRFDTKSVQYVVTQIVGSTLYWSLNNNTHALSISRDWLRNSLAMPLYLFNPAVLPTGSQNASTSDGVLLNLPSDNYVTGSYCKVSHRAIPSLGTVIGYAVVAAMVIAFILAMKIGAARWDRIETTEFPMLDFGVLTTLRDDDGNVISLPSRYADDVYEERTILDEVAGWVVGLRKHGIT